MHTINITLCYYYIINSSIHIIVKMRQPFLK